MVVKKDAETGNTVPLAGHGYNLYDPEGNKISMTLTYPEVVEIDTFYTDSNGYLLHLRAFHTARATHWWRSKRLSLMCWIPHRCISILSRKTPANMTA